MRRYLVVANQTLGGPQLAEAIRERVAAGPSEFHLVVPATRPHDHLVWSEGEAHALARERLERALELFRSAGAQCSGEVGDERPMLAVEDALIANPYDEIILSTLPSGVSRWLKQDLPARVSHKTGMPVTHVIVDAPKAARSA